MNMKKNGLGLLADSGLTAKWFRRDFKEESEPHNLSNQESRSHFSI